MNRRFMLTLSEIFWNIWMNLYIKSAWERLLSDFHYLRIIYCVFFYYICAYRQIKHQSYPKSTKNNAFEWINCVTVLVIIIITIIYYWNWLSLQKLKVFDDWYVDKFLIQNSAMNIHEFNHKSVYWKIINPLLPKMSYMAR